MVIKQIRLMVYKQIPWKVQLDAQVAAECINRRIPGCRVTPHNCKIQDYDADFYRLADVVHCCGVVVWWWCGVVY